MAMFKQSIIIQVTKNRFNDMTILKAAPIF